MVQLGLQARRRATEEFTTQIITITHLEPDILECKVKWALESITTNKASGGDGIPVELFQILKDDAVTGRPSNRLGMQPWALSLPDKELCLREALAVCTPPAPEPSAKRPGS